MARKVLAKEIEQQANKIEQQANTIAILRDFAKLYLPEIKANSAEDQTQAIQQHIDVLGAAELPDGSIVLSQIMPASDFTGDGDEKAK